MLSPSQHRRAPLGHVLCLTLLLIPACGRSPLGADDDGSLTPEASTTSDAALPPDLPHSGDVGGPAPDSPPAEAGPGDAAPADHHLAPDAPPPPPQPDLVIKQFSAKVSGSDIVYDLIVCNQGGVPSFVFRVDIYYNRLLPPGIFQLGDASDFILGLAPGACHTISRTYANAPVGLYNAWAFVDTLATVAEANEDNNTAGPHVTLVGSSLDCISLCGFAISCGEFKLLEYPQCLTWCNALSPPAKQCAQQAAQKQSCADLQSCVLPPPPPPPPPPWACLTLCNYVIDQCKLLPSGQLIACTVGCLSLPTTKIQCGLDAMNKQQCLQTVLCIF